jgi:prevent-host-death family protein
MRISVSAAKGRLAGLVKRAEAGDDVILTRRGKEVARLVPIVAPRGAASRRALMERIRASASARAAPGPDAARSQDFLYDNDGLSASPGQGGRR